MPFLSYVTWDVSPVIFEIGPLMLRWYGLCFAMAFVVGYQIMKFVYKKEGYSLPELDRLSMFMIFGVVIGARLGHVFFYQPEEYLKNPLDILKIWEGGLASHGAAIGILIAMFIYSRKKGAPNYMWVLDRVILTVPIGGAFVRLGNLMNSEIYGKPTDLPWAFIFVRDEASGNVPRHPTQIYEALGYVLIFILLFSYYRKRGKDVRPGSLFGLFLIMLFGLRFLVEFLKVEQVLFERGMMLNMGQLLSLPFIALGIFMLIRAYRIDRGMKI